VTVALPERVSDPVDELVGRVRAIAAQTVDALQVAASLESDGVTDAIARDRYGHADVFALAEDVRRRVGQPTTAAVRAEGPPRMRAAARRDIAHGVLYLLPAAVFPAALAVLGRRSLVLAIVLAGALGWVWAGGSSWLAYRLLGSGAPGAAARVLRWSAIAGVPAAAAAGVLVVATTHAGYALAVMATAQMAYQMASTLLVFYQREAWLFAAMTPAALAGVCYLAAGGWLLPLAIAAGGGAVAVAFGLGLRQTTGPSEPDKQSEPAKQDEPPLRAGLRRELPGLPAVLAYSALSAAYFLHAQAPYMLGSADIPLAAVPLFVGMGVVEWRARRFAEQGRALLARVRFPREFVARVWLLLAREASVCMGAVALLAAAWLPVLAAAGLLTPAGAVMTAANIVLAGAYFVGFLLAGMARYGWLCGSLAGCLALHVVLVSAAPGVSALADITVFTGSALLLLLLFSTAMVGRVDQARFHR
jgi:hypothetical protein